MKLDKAPSSSFFDPPDTSYKAHNTRWSAPSFVELPCGV